MNILFISHVDPRPSQGLSWSVPARVKAQIQFDNVLWVNSCEGALPHWKNVPCFHELREYGRLKLKNMPSPFDNPDVVVFEGFYNDINEVFLGLELSRRKIPYIIVPRSALTYQAYNNHAWLKKRIAHKLFYDRFISNAWAIQYLTNQEKCDSEILFNKKSFVIPNGFTTPNCVKNHFSSQGLNAVYIGRLDINQKGLDVLIGAIKLIKNELLEKEFKLTIYGPQNADYFKLNAIIYNSCLNSIVKLGGETVGKGKEDVLLNSDLFVLTSRFEGHPMGLIEALAYGVPSLVTQGANMLTEIVDSNAGWGTKLDENAIANTLLEIISHRDILEIKSENAISLASNYRWEVLAESLHNELMSII